MANTTHEGGARPALDVEPGRAMDAQRDDAPESLRSLRDTPSERMRVALRQSDRT